MPPDLILECFWTSPLKCLYRSASNMWKSTSSKVLNIIYNCIFGTTLMSSHNWCHSRNNMTHDPCCAWVSGLHWLIYELYQYYWYQIQWNLLIDSGCYEMQLNHYVKIFQLEHMNLPMGCDLTARILPAGWGENDEITYQLESSKLGHTQLVRNHKPSCQLAGCQPAGGSVNNRWNE